ncbi:cell division protein FtsA [Treponema primitia]|uniref:cell division protein FtsA n=1 Tax=Treponema primitia TaxID=88058 RepID=UPI0002555341|nr:cell division protein FtsA [Treponema primitia]
MANDGLVVGLDIGTTSIRAVIGERTEKGTIEITGVGISPSSGLRKGVVVNIEATLQSVAAAIEAAEMMSGREVHACWTGIGGNHVDGVNSRGVVAVTGRSRDEKENREIGPEDIVRVLEVARAMVFPMDRQILEVIPQTYIVDKQPGIRNPLNMIARGLEAEVHIITCSANSAQNLIKCVNRAGFRVNDLILQTLAAGRAVLTEEEKELGVALVDLGGGTTDVMVCCQGAPYSTLSVPLGGAEITQDISIVKNISFENAERAKIDARCCIAELLENDDDIIIEGLGGRPPLPIPKSQIAVIVRPRLAEIFRMVKDKLDALPLSRPLGGGIVLTGGGAEFLGAVELAAQIFKMPVRIGNPLSMGGLQERYNSPLFATAIGLVLEGNIREDVKTPDRGPDTKVREKKGQVSFFGKIWEWLKKEFF